jgi:hypothetical protein
LGETYQVARYAKPVAYLISEKDYKRLMSGQDCKKCVEEIKTSIKGIVSSVSARPSVSAGESPDGSLDGSIKDERNE